MQCPRCIINLTEDQHKDVKFYSCQECCGTWFLKKDLKKAVKPGFVPRIVLDAMTPKVVHKEDGHVIRCPYGGHAPMKRVYKNYVNMDICKEHHGVWLDGGELKAMKHLDSTPVLLGDETKWTARESGEFLVGDSIIGIVFSLFE